MEQLNIWAILVAALSTFLLGGLWYSPMLFLNSWLQADNRPAIFTGKKSHGVKAFALAFIASLIAATVFASLQREIPATLMDSMYLALKVGGGFVAASFAINYIFAGRSFKLFLIDAGYHIVQFLLFGLILGLWR